MIWLLPSVERKFPAGTKLASSVLNINISFYLVVNADHVIIFNLNFVYIFIGIIFYRKVIVLQSLFSLFILLNILIIHHKSDSIRNARLGKGYNLSAVEIDTIMTRKVRSSEIDHNGSVLWFSQLEHYFTRQNIKSEGTLHRDLLSVPLLQSPNKSVT